MNRIQKNTIRWKFSSPNTSSKLMKLCQSEPFSIFNHHDGCIGNIDPHFYYSSRNQDINFPGSKGIHDPLFFRSFHFAMQGTDLYRIRKKMPQFFGIFFHIFQIGSFSWFDHGTDHKNLMTILNLFCKKLICFLPIGNPNHTVFNGNSSLRHLLYNGNI